MKSKVFTHRKELSTIFQAPMGKEEDLLLSTSRAALSHQILELSIEYRYIPD